MTRRRFHPLAALALLFAALAPVASGCGADHELVGGRCAEGYTQCGERCVNLLDDPQNCGACGVVCDPGPCVEGLCRSGGDGSLADGSEADGQSDGAAGDGTSGDGAIGDGSDSSTAGAFDDGPSSDGPVADGINGRNAREACVAPF